MGSISRSAVSLVFVWALCFLGLEGNGQTIEEKLQYYLTANEKNNPNGIVLYADDLLKDVINELHDSIAIIHFDNFSWAFSSLGNYQKSLELNKQCLEISEKLYGKEHRDYAISLNNLALNYSNLGKYHKAMELNQQCLELRENLYGKEHPDYAQSIHISFFDAHLLRKRCSYLS